MASMDGRSAVSHQADKQRRLKMRGAMQPARLSVFEPMIFALKRLDPPGAARVDAKNSRVLQQVDDARRKLIRYLPPKSSRVAPPHACSKRGRSAVTTRCLVKKAPSLPATQRAHSTEDLVDMLGFSRWHA